MTTSPSIPAARRLASVDTFRALTLFLMLFVNDIPGLRHVPHWLLHAEATEDMMGFSDLIFPAFLFCMGLSIPLAIQARARRGDTVRQILAHLSARSLALVLMGLFSMNSSSVPGGLSHGWFLVLMVIGFFLVWGVYPRESRHQTLFRAMKTLGAALLLFLIIYRYAHGLPLTIGWWGILGLIGWTYAVCAGAYLLAGQRLWGTLVAWAVMILLSLFSHSDHVPADSPLRFLLLPFIPSDWTLHALGMSGVAVMLLMQRLADPRRPLPFIALLCLTGAVMFALGEACHPHWIISKIQATPTWLFYSLSAFLPLFALLYYCVDVRGFGGLLRLLRPAGTATLTCYVLSYLWYALFELLPLRYPALVCAGVPGLLRSLCVAALLTAVTGLLVRIRVRLKV